MKQLTVTLFQDGLPVASFVVMCPQDQVPQNWEHKYLAKYAPIYGANGYRVEFGEQGRTCVIAQEYTSPRK